LNSYPSSFTATLTTLGTSELSDISDSLSFLIAGTLDVLCFDLDGTMSCSHDLLLWLDSDSIFYSWMLEELR